MAIKLIDNTARFEVISQYDDAIDGKSKEGDAAFTKYMETLNTSDLIKKADCGEPTIFVIRCLKNSENTALQAKHYAINTETKDVSFKHGYAAYLTECFEAGCLGIKLADGSIKPVTVEDIGNMHALSIGATITFLTSMGKNLKNV